jgi:CDP-glucose 4,6-dehydratase
MDDRRLLVEQRPNADFCRGRSVFLTGHTGFVGGWLAFWLARLGAQVTGYSLNLPTEPSFYNCVRLKTMVPGTLGDVRDREELSRQSSRRVRRSFCISRRSHLSA